MCRNIRTLFNFDPPVTDDEVRAASLQFVRKITGFNKPSKANEEAFQAAIDEIAGISRRLLRSLETSAISCYSLGQDPWAPCRYLPAREGVPDACGKSTQVGRSNDRPLLGRTVLRRGFGF